MSAASLRTGGRRFGPLLRAVVAATALGLFASSSVGAETAGSADGQDRDGSESAYFSLEIDGSRAGYAEQHERRAGGRVTTEQVFEFQIRRGEATVKLRQEARFVETEDAKPIEGQSKVWAGAEATERTVRYGAGGRRVETVQAGVRHVEELPLAEGFWLPPAAAGTLVRAALKEKRERFTLRTIDPAAGVDPFDVDYVLRGQEELTLDGESVPVTVYVVRTSLISGLETVRFFDADGDVVREELPLLPGVRVVATRSDASVVGSALEAPELMVPTFIEPSRPIAGPRELQSATYRLRLTGSTEGGLDLPSGGAQQVFGDEGSGTRTVRVDVGMIGRTDEAAPTDAQRAATAGLNHEDPVLRALVAKALVPLPPGASEADKARALRRFVAGHVSTKDLSTAMATASEVARSREGDCTEHAVLLAALLRGAGIASRLVSGVVYVEELLGRKAVFGYHMWTRAYVDGRWVDFDATLPGDRDFDAAHIAVAVVDGLDATRDKELFAPVRLFGRLAIDVVSAR